MRGRREGEEREGGVEGRGRGVGERKRDVKGEIELVNTLIVLAELLRFNPLVAKT